MTQNKSFAELAMDQTRIPSDASAVTTTLSKSLKDGEVLADDGNSYSSVQTAQDNASSWIKLPPSTFNESVTVDTAGLSVVGSGGDTVIDGQTNGDAISVAAADTTIRNISVQTTPGGGNLFRGIHTATGADSGTITDVTVPDTDSTGIRIELGSDWIVNNTRIKSADERGVAITSSVTNTIMSNVIVSGTTDSSAVQPFSAGENVISNCVLQNAGQDGIDMTSDDSIVTGCRIIGSADNGLEINSGTDNLLADIRISGSGGPDFVDGGTSTLVATDDSGNPTIITDDTSGQQA